MKKIYGCNKWTSYPTFTSSWRSCATTRMPSNELHSHATCIIQVLINCCNLSYSQHKCTHKAEICIYNRKCKPYLLKKSNHFLPSQLNGDFFLLKIVLLWIILTHINDGISSSILAKLFIHLLLVLWMSSWMQCPTLVNEMTPFLTISANLLHLLFTLSLLIKFPEIGQSFPKFWNMMVI